MALTQSFLGLGVHRRGACHVSTTFRAAVLFLFVASLGGLADDRGDVAPINCTLAVLRMWSGEKLLDLQPQFSPDVFHYGVTLDFESGPLWPDAETVGDNGCEARRSDSGGDVPAGGYRDVSVVVNSDEPKEYTVRVRRRKGDDVRLTSLAIAGAYLSPNFTADRPEYVANLRSLTAALPWRVVLSCVPVDGGQTVELSSIEPASAMADRAVRTLLEPPAPMVLDTGGARRGQRNITLGHLAGNGAQLVDADGRPRLMPLRIQVRVWPSDRGSAAPGVYVVQLNAPIVSVTTSTTTTTISTSTTSTIRKPVTTLASTTVVAANVVGAQVRAADAASAGARSSDAGLVQNTAASATSAPASAVQSAQLARAGAGTTALTGLAVGKRRQNSQQRSPGGKAGTMTVVVIIVLLGLLNICRMHPPENCMEPPARALAREAAASAAARTAELAESNVSLLRAAVLSST